MAIAGRVAIVPKGEYSNAVTYDKLDLVMFNNDAYVAKKASTGIEPTNDEYWMLILNNVVAEDLENIINGTTPVGKAKDADTVDGYHIVGTGTRGVPVIFEDYGILEIGRGIDFHSEEGQDYIQRILVDSNGDLVVSGQGVIATTADLANYLSLRGGIVDGHIELKTVSNDVRKLYLQNSVRRIGLEVTSDGSGYLWDSTNGKAIINSTGSGENTFNGTATNAEQLGGASLSDVQGWVQTECLQKSGGNVTADVTIGKTDTAPYLRLEAIGAVSVRMPSGFTGGWDRGFKIATEDGADLGGLGVFGDGQNVSHYYIGNEYWNPILAVTPSTRKVTVNGNEVLHTGNKPTGSYTGNGSATERAISTGGIGQFLILWSANGMGIVSPLGGWLFDTSGSVSFLSSVQLYYSSGTLKVATDNAIVNSNGASVTYQTI